MSGFAKTLTLVPTIEEADTVVALDMANIAYRAAHGTPTLFTSTGVFSGHVYGTFKIIVGSLRASGITGKVCLYFCWEGRHAKKPRLAIMPDYKGGRNKSIENPVPAVMSVFQFVPGFHAVALEREGDDALAKAAWDHHLTKRVVVMSGDKDMWGLIQLPGVQVWKFANGGGGSFITVADVEEEFGVTNPAKVYLAKSFFGDSSDSIKGVFRLQKKQITPILNLESVNTPEEAYAEINSGKHKLTKSSLEKLKDYSGFVHQNWKVVRPRVDNFVWQIDPVVEGNEGEFREMLAGYECSSLLPEIPFFFGCPTF